MTKRLLVTIAPKEEGRCRGCQHLGSTTGPWGLDPICRLFGRVKLTVDSEPVPGETGPERTSRVFHAAVRLDQCVAAEVR